MSQQDMNQQNNKKKGSPDNIPPMGEDGDKKKSKFNIYWIYGIIFLSIIAYNVFRGVSSNGIETDKLKFYEMVRQGDVEEYKIIRNRNIVRVSLNKDSVTAKKAFYETQLNSKEAPKNYEMVAKINQPQLYFNVVNGETFSKEMEEFYKTSPNAKKVDELVDNEGEAMAQILNLILPILLIAFLFIIMMRKVGGPGGSGGPGGIFNIGKSKATLFEKGTRVNINFNDVAGLDEAKVEVM